MGDGRTIWWPKDSGWWRREAIVALGEEFGPAGPAVLDWLSCEAKAQNDGGQVKAGIRTVARGCFVEAGTVERVLSRCVTLVTLEDFEEREGRFTCRISGWRQDNDRGNAAHRKALQREREAASHGESRSVTPSRIEERREETSEANASDKAARSRAVDQDQLPNDYPPSLEAPAWAALVDLQRFQDQRGGSVPTIRGVALAVAAFPDRDHAAVLQELEHWALVGRGSRKPIKDWARTLRTFLSQSVPADPSQFGGQTMRTNADVLRVLEGGAA